MKRPQRNLEQPLDIDQLIKTTLAALDTAVEEADRKRKQLQTTIDNNSKHHDNAKSKIKELEKELQAEKIKTLRLEATVFSLNQRVKELSSTAQSNVDLRERIEVLHEGLKLANATHDTRDQTLADTKNKLATVSQLLAETKAKLIAVTEENKALQQQGSEKESEITKLKSQVEKLAAVLEKVKANLRQGKSESFHSDPQQNTTAATSTMTLYGSPKGPLPKPKRSDSDASPTPSPSKTRGSK